MVGAFSLLCGVVLLVAWSIQVSDWFKSANWSTTRGTIKGSVVEPAERRDILGAAKGFKPVVRYAYDVDGQTYVSSRFSALREPFFTLEAEAEEFAARFPVGNHVRVRVHPNQPRQSLLERRMGITDALPGYLAMASILLGIVLI